MGLPKNEDETPPSVTDFFNACMKVTEFEGIQRLPDDRRIQAIKTAFTFIDLVISGQIR